MTASLRTTLFVAHEHHLVFEEDWGKQETTNKIAKPKQNEPGRQYFKKREKTRKRKKNKKKVEEDFLAGSSGNQFQRRASKKTQT